MQLFSIGVLWMVLDYTAGVWGRVTGRAFQKIGPSGRASSKLSSVPCQLSNMFAKNFSSFLCTIKWKITDVMNWLLKASQDGAIQNLWEDISTFLRLIEKGLCIVEANHASVCDTSQ